MFYALLQNTHGEKCSPRSHNSVSCCHLHTLSLQSSMGVNTGYFGGIMSLLAGISDWKSLRILKSWLRAHVETALLLTCTQYALRYAHFLSLVFRLDFSYVSKHKGYENFCPLSPAWRCWLSPLISVCNVPSPLIKAQKVQNSLRDDCDFVRDCAYVLN